jgi:hypothetical protein
LQHRHLGFFLSAPANISAGAGRSFREPSLTRDSIASRVCPERGRAAFAGF